MAPTIGLNSLSYPIMRTLHFKSITYHRSYWWLRSCSSFTSSLWGQGHNIGDDWEARLGLLWLGSWNIYHHKPSPFMSWNTYTVTKPYWTFQTNKKPCFYCWMKLFVVCPTRFHPWNLQYYEETYHTLSVMGDTCNDISGFHLRIRFLLRKKRRKKREENPNLCIFLAACFFFKHLDNPKPV